ncbi:hypothetical protein [Kineosporia babensis]|uniref:Uncharacterized protein n=1 Tax=Kineosporia babensis TaxID=499548 RepID=A0A9X1SVB9_9ACTN|nr:hypothetical protein [Kineosporia babensis]MCD5313481.1 hypothetical protein [Kineosporia babensis]
MASPLPPRDPSLASDGNVFAQSDKEEARSIPLEISRAMRRSYVSYRTPESRAKALSPLLEVRADALLPWIVAADESDDQQSAQPTREETLADARLIWNLGLDPDDDAYAFDGPG